MLSIGEFAAVCKVSTKTLRYYAEIGLILPDAVNPENGYRYYAVEQLQTMLLINRLKSYNFSLEEIKTILKSREPAGEKLYISLADKKKELEQQVQELTDNLIQLEDDLMNLARGNSIMSYMDSIDVQLVEIPKMYLLSIRKKVHQCEFAGAYETYFYKLFKRIQAEELTAAAPPMVLFHSAEFSSDGLDTEFAVPVREHAKGTRDFVPGLCLKTVLHGSYSKLPSVYAKQREWAEREGYVNSDALYEVYATDPALAAQESELITEIYYPVKKQRGEIL